MCLAYGNTNNVLEISKRQIQIQIQVLEKSSTTEMKKSEKKLKKKRPPQDNKLHY